MTAAHPRRRPVVGLLFAVFAALATISGVAVAEASEDEASAPTSSPTVRNIEASESASPIVSLGAPDSPRDWLTLIGGVILLVTIIVWQGTLFRRRRQEHERVLHRLESLGSRRPT